MSYYVGNMPVGNSLAHHGIKGMKWGQRRYQNPDGSLTAAGQARYGRLSRRAAGARSLASQNRAAAGRTSNRALKAVYGVNNRYYTRKAGRLSAKAKRIRTGTTALDDIRRAGGFKKATRDAWTMTRTARSSNPNRKRNLKRAATIAGTAAAVAGAAYLGKRYGKNVVRNVARSAGVKTSAFKANNRLAKASANAYRKYGVVGANLRRGDKAFIDAANTTKRAAGNLKSKAQKAAIKTGFKANALGYKAKAAAKKATSKARKVSKGTSTAGYVRFFNTYPESMDRAMAAARVRSDRKQFIRRSAAAGAVAGGVAAAGGFNYGLKRKKKKTRK